MLSITIVCQPILRIEEYREVKTCMRQLSKILKKGLFRPLPDERLNLRGIPFE